MRFVAGLDCFFLAGQVLQFLWKKTAILGDSLQQGQEG